jgi:hypothetical protein
MRCTFCEHVITRLAALELGVSLSASPSRWDFCSCSSASRSQDDSHMRLDSTALLCALLRARMWCRVLTLASNQLEGGIPFGVGSLVSLSVLTIDNNRVSEAPQSLLSLAALR